MVLPRRATLPSRSTSYSSAVTTAAVPPVVRKDTTDLKGMAAKMHTFRESKHHLYCA